MFNLNLNYLQLKFYELLRFTLLLLAINEHYVIKRQKKKQLIELKEKVTILTFFLERLNLITRHFIKELPSFKSLAFICKITFISDLSQLCIVYLSLLNSQKFN